MNKCFCGGLLCGLAALVLGMSACGKESDHMSAEKEIIGVHLRHTSYCLLADDRQKIRLGQDLMTISGGDAEAKPGTVYRFKIGLVATSYPPQTNALSWEKLEEVAGPIKADFDLGHHILQHLGEDAVSLLDVRTPEEFAEGHLPGADNLPLADIGSQVVERIPDKDRIVLVYCRSGARSAKAAAELSQAGYHLVFDLGGILDYQGDLE